MKEKTIDYILRATWQAVSRMYNEEASKFDGSIAIGFALLSIDKKDGTPSTYISSRMGMEATSLTRTLKTLEEKINSLNREILDIKNTNSSLSHENELLKNPVVHDCEFYKKAKNDLMGLSDELEKLKHDIKIKTNEIQWLTS